MIKFPHKFFLGVMLSLTLGAGSPPGAFAQTPPSPARIASYDGLHQAAHDGDINAINQLVADGANLEERDGDGRTALLVAAYASQDDAVRALALAGADMNAFDDRAYDLVTIAAVANDLGLLKTGLELGNSPKNITSPYIGTALIAAAHLGHHEVVGVLIGAGAPLDHVNNLAWTALIEAVVLGDGGPDHVATVRALVVAGADRSIGDMSGVTPLEHARARRYQAIIEILSADDR